jgi:hypothetical protein
MNFNNNLHIGGYIFLLKLLLISQHFLKVIQHLIIPFYHRLNVMVEIHLISPHLLTKGIQSQIVIVLLLCVGEGGHSCQRNQRAMD